MRRAIVSRLLAAMLSLATTAAAAVPGPPSSVPGPPPSIPDRHLLRLNGQPALMLYAQGVQDSFDLGLYREVGFNTVVIEVPWTAPLDFTAADAMLRSAHRLGLAAVVQVHPAQPPPALKLRINAADVSYRRACVDYLRAVAEHFRSAVGMGALMLEDDAEQRVQDDDAGFQEFLGQHYEDLGSLNTDWGSSFANISQVTMIAAARLSAAQYGGMSRPCVLVGEYRSESYASLQQLWAGAVQGVDPLHPLIAGRQDLPRSAIGTPHGCAGVVVAAQPPDLLPVDVGRRGGQFVTIVSLPEGAAENPDTAGPFLADCLVHGAGGVAFPSWPALANNRPLLTRLKPMLRRLSQSASQIEAPRPRFAVIYEPLSPGVPGGGASAPYGFMPQPADHEPGSLMQTLSRGSVFGFADVLSLDDLSPTILSRYRVLLAPSLFVAPPGAVNVLSQYVAQGGVLVTDLGLDLASLGRLEEPWPEALSRFFGIVGTTPVQFALFQYPRRPKEPMEGLDWYPQMMEPALFPDLTSNALLSLKGDSVPFSGPRSYVRLQPGADLSLFGFNPPATRDHTSASGIFIRQVGQGYAVFASFRLWSEWTGQGNLFPIFLGDLIGRGATSRLSEIGATANSICFTPAADNNFTLMESGPTAALGRVRIDGATMALRSGCIMQALPGSPPTSLAYADLEPQQPVSCPTVPVTLVLQTGFVTAALDAYTPAHILIEICGSGSSVKRENGRLRIEPGDTADAAITVQDGVYRIAPGSRHEAIVQDLRPGGRSRRIVLQASADGTISFSGRFDADRIEIKPLTAQGAGE